MIKWTRITKKWYWIGGILLVLIVARLLMPYFVTRYVNKVLSELEGYSGSIYDVDIHLYRGAYSIDSLKVFKIDGNKEVPFVDIPVTDLSVEWGALFDGEIVGEVIFEDPKLNFIGGNPKPESGEREATANQSGGDVDWTRPIRELMPLKINKMEIQRGTVSFHNFSTRPQVTVSLTDLEVLAANLRNTAGQDERLPSTISATATSIGGGRLFLNMAINILKPIPDVDLDMKFEHVNMPALNKFFEAYANVDIERGSFNLYSEVTIDSGMVAGYVKPIAVDVKVTDRQVDQNDSQKQLNLLWQSFVGLVTEVFENQKENQFATRVSLDGNLNNIDARVWPSVWNIFRNAFVKAFERNTDNSVRLADKLAPGEEKEKTDATVDRKTERRQKKEERKEARREKKRRLTKPG